MLATRIAASRPVPHACWMSYAGVGGSSLEPSTTSRVRFQSRECLSTAPATTSSTRSPGQPEPGDQAVQRRAEQVRVARLGVARRWRGRTGCGCRRAPPPAWLRLLDLTCTRCQFRAGCLRRCLLASRVGPWGTGTRPSPHSAPVGRWSRGSACQSRPACTGTAPAIRWCPGRCCSGGPRGPARRAGGEAAHRGRGRAWREPDPGPPPDRPPLYARRWSSTPPGSATRPGCDALYDFFHPHARPLPQRTGDRAGHAAGAWPPPRGRGRAAGAGGLPAQPRQGARPRHHRAAGAGRAGSGGQPRVDAAVPAVRPAPRSSPAR